MSESLGGTPMTIFHTWYGMCEGVDRDSRYVVSGFISCNDIKHSMCKFQIVWNVDDCGVPLHAHFRRGVALVGKIRLLGIAHPVVGSPFQVQGVFRKTALTRGRF